MNPQKDVLVVLESSGEDRQEINMGLLSEGRGIVERLGGSLHAMAVGQQLDSTSMLEEFGVQMLHILKGEGLTEYRCEAFSWAIGEFLKGRSPRLSLLAHSDRGLELAPRVACHLGSAAVMDCLDIRVDSGRLIFVKSLYGDQFEQEVSFASGLAEIAAIRPEVLNRRGAGEPSRLTIREHAIEVPREIILTQHLGQIPPVYSTVDIMHARRILGAGMGTVGDNLQILVRELADLLEGSLGSTRPIVDEGHLPKERMIGLTGKQISPDLYLALGVSGSPHHVAGIQGSKRIVCINKDPRAPIYQFCDAGFVGDIRNVLPKLISRIRAWKGASSNEGV
jgi:electron transfer flavoprotein alpha subunit